MYSLTTSHDREGMVTQQGPEELVIWYLHQEGAVNAGAQLALFSTQSGTPECQGNQYRYPHNFTDTPKGIHQWQSQIHGD